MGVYKKDTDRAPPYVTVPGVMEPTASSERKGEGAGERAGTNPATVGIRSARGEIVLEAALWIQDGEGSDQLIQLTEGVIVNEQREPREELFAPHPIEGDGSYELHAGSGLAASLTVEQRDPDHTVIELRPEGSPLRIGASWDLDLSEHLTGTGCRHGLRFDQSGRTIQLGADRRYTGPDCPPDMLEIGGVPMGDYVPIPWLLSSRGWAALVECEGPGIELDLASDVSLSTRSVAGPFRLHVFTNPSPAARLRRYVEMTGMPQVLPEWAYGHWKSRDVYSHESDVLEDFEGYLEHDLPLDAIVLDSPWETQYNTWKFNPWQFPDPDALIKRMRSHGVRTVVWCTPWTNLESVDGQRPPDPESERSHREPADNYEEGRAAGHYVKQPDGEAYVAKWWMGTGSPLDFTSEDARRWWIDQVRGALAMGVEGIKADDGEGYYFPPEVQFADGRTGADAAWAYPKLYREVMQEALDLEHPETGVLFARSGAIGAQGPGIVWGGDQVSDFWSLRTLVAASLTAAASGISNWSHDVGGYLGKMLVEPCAPELFVRWAQFGALTPLMQAHGRFEQEAWRYGHSVLEIFREAVMMHERLVPYILSAAATAARTGLPIIRPLPLVDPGDERGWTIADAYMFGPSIWVAPVLEEGAEQLTTHLPRGCWIDYWTGAETEGGREVTVPAPLERIPVWIRSGSIIPTHPRDAVAAGLGEEGGASRALELTLWGTPSLGRAKIRLADETTATWSEASGWSVQPGPDSDPDREISFHRKPGGRCCGHRRG